MNASTSTTTIPSLSPAELAYLYASLAGLNSVVSSPGHGSGHPPNHKPGNKARSGRPLRPDGRAPAQFRPVSAETGIVAGANGSARVGFADGGQAVVGIKGEVERTVYLSGSGDRAWRGRGAKDGGAIRGQRGEEEMEVEMEGEGGVSVVEGDPEAEGNEGPETGAGGVQVRVKGESSWVEMAVEIPGAREDDALPVFLAEMMREALVGAEEMGGGLKERLVINGGWHWRIYIDILLLSPPSSYPLPLLSLTTHLALLSTKLPRLISKEDEDPMFSDDWDAAEYLYPRPQTSPSSSSNPANTPTTFFRPPVTILAIAVGDNVIFDPTREEIAAASAVLAVSVAREQLVTTNNNDNNHSNNNNNKKSSKPPLRLISLRTIDPPARMTTRGVPNAENAVLLGLAPAGTLTALSRDDVQQQFATGFGGPAESTGATAEEALAVGVWRPRVGGVKRGVISRIVRMVVQPGGVGEEVMEGLEGFVVD